MPPVIPLLIYLGVVLLGGALLYFSIGLHGGWIFWLRFYGVFTGDQAGANLEFWGTHKMIDGWAALFLLVPIFLLLWCFPWRRSLRGEVKECARCEA